MKLVFSLLSLLFISIQSFAQNSAINLKKINNKVYVYEAFLETQQWGKVSCNGMIYIHKNEAIIFDTPSSNADALELINLVKDSLKAKIIGVVINHFHEDCLGGLKAFHQSNIPSYANFKTLELAKQTSLEIPQIGFTDTLILNIGKKQIQNYYLGAAHSADNIVSYIPTQKILFGGCMVKAINATKGNLADADVKTWSTTIIKVKQLNAKIIIPGHGTYGGPELLGYTEDLFK